MSDRQFNRLQTTLLAIGLAAAVALQTGLIRL
jgi:hypothetical protein